MQLTDAQLKAIRSQAYTTADRREFVYIDEAIEALAALSCSDPIECGHEAALGQAEAELERLRAELDRRDQADAEALADQTLMKGLTVKDGAISLDLIPPRELAALWVHCARGMLGDAENYSETRVDMPSASMEVSRAGEFERFALIVQRVGKTTPHEAREQAEAERDRALAELAAIRERAHARSEELLAYRDRRPSNDRVRRHAFELAAGELRQLVEPPAGEASDA
jgi:hypothetical protein